MHTRTQTILENLQTLYNFTHASQCQLNHQRIHLVVQDWRMSSNVQTSMVLIVCNYSKHHDLGYQMASLYHQATPAGKKLITCFQGWICKFLQIWHNMLLNWANMFCMCCQHCSLRSVAENLSQAHQLLLVLWSLVFAQNWQSFNAVWLRIWST